MALLCSITEGWTKEIGPFTLKIDGQPVPLTGYTVEAILTPFSRGGGPSDMTSDVRKDSDQTGNPGRVYLKPDAVDLQAKYSPYTLHWKVTDGNGDVVFWPNGDPDTIKVVHP